MNKQIEEMARDIRIVETEYLVAMVTADIDDAIDGAAPRDERIATALYEKGYRKTEDIAREIFEEIVKFIFSEIPDELMPIYKAEKDFRDGVISGKREAFFKVLTHLDNHLRKKYESEGAE